MLSLQNETRRLNNWEVDRAMDQDYPNSMGAPDVKMGIRRKPIFPPPMTKTDPNQIPMVQTIVKKKLSCVSLGVTRPVETPVGSLEWSRLLP
jgi:hypothetical protein